LVVFLTVLESDRDSSVLPPFRKVNTQDAGFLFFSTGALVPLPACRVGICTGMIEGGNRDSDTKGKTLNWNRVRGRIA